MFPGHMWGDWWMWLIGVLVMFLFWGGLIALIFFAIRSIVQPKKSGHEQPASFKQRENPLEVLKERYARGEINRQEYMEMKRDLEGD
jgi:putative membrane protein